jgi:predicted ATPase with chaperone activity
MEKGRRENPRRESPGATIADLAGSDAIRAAHLAEAIQYRAQAGFTLLN